MCTKSRTGQGSTHNPLTCHRARPHTNTKQPDKKQEQKHRISSFCRTMSTDWRTPSEHWRTHAVLQQTELLAGVINKQDCRDIRTACCCIRSLRIRVEARVNVTEGEVISRQLQLMQASVQYCPTDDLTNTTQKKRTVGIYGQLKRIRRDDNIVSALGFMWKKRNKNTTMPWEPQVTRGLQLQEPPEQRVTSESGRRPRRCAHWTGLPTTREALLSEAGFDWVRRSKLFCRWFCFLLGQAGCISVAAWTQLKVAFYDFVSSGGLIVDAKRRRISLLQP